MNIQSISKENANANVTLSASELVLICNMFHEQLAKEKSNPKFLELYGCVSMDMLTTFVWAAL